jgi:hypothetical protein
MIAKTGNSMGKVDVRPADTRGGNAHEDFAGHRLLDFDILNLGDLVILM